MSFKAVFRPAFSNSFGDAKRKLIPEGRSVPVFNCLKFKPSPNRCDLVEPLLGCSFDTFEIELGL